MNDLRVMNIPHEFTSVTGNKCCFNQATSLSLYGQGVRAEQKGIKILPKRPDQKKGDVETMIYPVEIDSMYAAQLYATCRELQAQGYGPCDFALITPLGIVPGQAKFFLPSEIIGAYSEEIEVTLRFYAETTDVYVNTLTGQKATVKTEKRLVIKFMENTVLSVNAMGQVYSGREEVLEVTVEEVITEIREAYTVGRPAKIGKCTLCSKPYKQSPVKMYEEVIEHLSVYIQKKSSVLGAW